MRPVLEKPSFTTILFHRLKKNSILSQPPVVSFSESQKRVTTGRNETTGGGDCIHLNEHMGTSIQRHLLAKNHLQNSDPFRDDFCPLRFYMGLFGQK